MGAAHYGRPVVERVLLAEPRGFCAGVEMAIKALSWMVTLFDPPVYCYHEIVHNKLVVDRFREMGVIFVEDVGEVPPGAPLMLSAHGSAPEVVSAASEHGRTVVNAVCPLVTKVHHEAKVRARRGFTILYVGHQGHDEAIGTLAVAPESMRLVQQVEDVEQIVNEIADPNHVALLAQTTLAMGEWKDIADAARGSFPELWTATRNDLCFATTNRQTALAEIARHSDAVVVIGSANSSNTLALAKVAAELCANVVRVDTAEELDAVQFPSDSTVGVTAGASAPEDLVQAVIAKLDPKSGIQHVHVTDEDEYFPPPRELRDLIVGIATMLAWFTGTDSSNIRADIATFDRANTASTVLSRLGGSRAFD